MESNINLNDRVYIVKSLCTGKVKQIGPISDKKGRFFGIEADITNESFSDGTQKGEKQFDCTENRAIFTNVNDLIPLTTFSKLYEKMKTLTAKYEKLILEKDNLTVENEKMKKEISKKDENIQVLINEKGAISNEVSLLKTEITQLKSENDSIIKSASEKSNNVSNIQVEKYIMKNQDLEVKIEKLTKEKENYEMLVGYYDELSVKKESEIGSLRETMKKFIEENERVKKDYEEMNNQLQENQGKLNVHKDQIENSQYNHVNILKDENDRLQIENERYASFALLGLIENSKNKFNSLKKHLITDMTNDQSVFENIQFITQLEKINLQKEFCNNQIYQFQLNKKEVKQENVSDIDMLKKQFHIFNAVVKNYCYSVWIEQKLFQCQSMKEFELIQNSSLNKIIISYQSVVFEYEINFDTDFNKIFENQEELIQKKDLEDEQQNENWLVMLRFLFNMLYVLKIQQHLQTDQDNNQYRAVQSFREFNEQLNGGIELSFNSDTAEFKLGECNSVFEQFKRLITNKFSSTINFDLDLFKKIQVQDFDGLIRQIFNFISQFKDHAKSNINFKVKNILTQIPMINEFTSNYKNFVLHSTQIEDNFKELQLNETKLTKHMTELKDDLVKKTKTIESLNIEKESLNHNNNSLEERLKEIRLEVDKFKKKESSGNSSKNHDLERNQGLNLGKSMQFQMDKYQKEKLYNLKNHSDDRKNNFIIDVCRDNTDFNHKIKIEKSYSNLNKQLIGNINVIDIENKTTNQCEEEHYKMIRGFAKYKNELQRVVYSQKKLEDSRIPNNVSDEKPKTETEILVSCLDQGNSSESKKVQLNEKDIQLLNKVLL